MSSQQYYGTGRRKRAVARVFLRPGAGKIMVNNKALNEYFSRDVFRMQVCQPLEVTQTGEKFDLFITVKGGGNTGQAGAIRHGVTHALIKYDEEDEQSGEGGGEGSFRHLLRQAGFVTRDSRRVERKKVGLKKARKDTQYSKR